MEQKAWIISVNMGYGHQRTAYPLRDLGEVINVNDYPGIPKKDRRTWETTRKGYEFISNFYHFPFIGKAVFSFLINSKEFILLNHQGIYLNLIFN